MRCLLVVGPVKTNTKQLRQTDGERFFPRESHVSFLNDSTGCNFRRYNENTKFDRQIVSDAITYPVIQEPFKFSNHALQRVIASRNLRLTFGRNKSEKDVAKKVSITIMRFPR